MSIPEKQASVHASPDVMDPSEKPFAFMLTPEFRDRLKEYFSVHNPSQDAVETRRDKLTLARLNMSEDFTADDVRKKAAEIKLEFHWFLGGRQSGKHDFTAGDLYRVLQLTGDVYCFEDVLLFLHTGMNLPQIRQHHKQFHVQQ